MWIKIYKYKKVQNTMFDLINLHPEKSIAIVGSAPSATIFKHVEDVIIGVNGGSKLISPNDYFLSLDERAHTRSWFKELPESITCIVQAQSAIYSEKFYPEDIRKKYQKKLDGYINSNPSELRILSDGFKLIPANSLAIQYLLNVPEPKKPHQIIRGVTQDEPISRNQKRINWGGTSACGALQIAHMMGAKEIHLYGIEFSNNVTDDASYMGDKYFYKPNPEETGRTLPSQREFMDKVIKEVMMQGTLVYSHGPTHLINSIKK